MDDEILTPIETFALSKAVKETAQKKAREKLSLGHHDVAFTVRVHGPLLVAGDSPTTVKEDVPPNMLLAFVIGKLSRRARAELLDCAQRELLLWRQHETDVVDVAPSALALADQFVACGHREKPGTKNGTVTAPLTVELVSRQTPRKKAA